MPIDELGLVAKLRKWADWLDLDIGTDEPAGADVREAATAIERLLAERDEARKAATAMSSDLFAMADERDRLKEALEYAAMGLGRIHDSLSSNGPKQASGEMTAHFMDRARQALAEDRK